MNENVCPNCGDDIISSSLNGKNCVCLRCGHKWNWSNPKMNSVNESITFRSCPKCGSPTNPPVSKYIKCPMCGYSTWDGSSKPDPNNPYTDFAKEMSLLHEALKAEGFKDSMVDILSKMAPIVWDKVANERARKAMGEAVKQSLKAKEDIDKEKWKKFERGCY